MSTVLLTKRIEFAAAHRYIKAEWDEAKNRAVFGPCYNPPAHGHNYMVEVTVLGEVDPKTGMVVNLFDLKRILLNVLEEFDHKNLNLDMPYFEGRIPTSENLARVLWSKLDTQKAIGTLHAIRLYEDEDLYADVTAAAGLNVASVTRRYSFTAVQGAHTSRHEQTVIARGEDVLLAHRRPRIRERQRLTGLLCPHRLGQFALVEVGRRCELRRGGTPL